MTEQYSNYPTKLKQNFIKLIFLIFIFYFILIIFLHQYYNKKSKIEKIQILEKYYHQLIELSLNKIAVIAHQLPANAGSKNIFNSTGSDIEICNAGKCFSYNLFRFGTLLNQHIPEFIYYKIELNKKLLYSNTKIQNTTTQAYQLEKGYNINDFTQISISLAIDNQVWNKIEEGIKEPFWILIIFFAANILLIYVVLYKSLRYFQNNYALYYHKKYESQLAYVTKMYQQELKNCKATLMKKIWENDFNKQKDLEINYLFAQQANQIAFINDVFNIAESKSKNSKLKKLNDAVPCSIVLYQADQMEEVNINQLICLFKNRFEQEDDNILIEITSDIKEINFSSSAALHQIIYSIISYLFFLLKKQSAGNIYNIKLTIGGAKDEIELNFEYDGEAIISEKELFKLSSQFFKTHANPFVLNLIQVFNVLKTNGFNLKIERNKYNTIEIKRHKQQNNNKLVKIENNVILLNSFPKKNND
ncbi:hypothetical protein [Candidatus Tisiphia endosymbiont of Beris chalybata]|uniref:hypothetical protein n=1 Tax=Candidatus Tisiphia endosymbiont of Beris chalybata TaxID=3066262 RepID=UPI00312C8EAB